MPTTSAEYARAKYVTAKHIAAKYLALPLLAASITTPSTAQNAVGDKSTEPKLIDEATRYSSDMTVIMNQTVNFSPEPVTPPENIKPPEDTELFQISGTGEITLPFDPQSLVDLPLLNNTVAVDMTVTREGKVASCFRTSDKTIQTEKEICSRLQGTSLYHWPNGAPFPNHIATTRLLFGIRHIPPYAPTLSIAPPGQGVPMEVTISFSAVPCVVVIRNEANFYYTESEGDDICNFAFEQADARNLITEPTNPFSGQTTTKFLFDLKAADDYVPGQPLHETVYWDEIPLSPYGKSLYNVPPLAESDKMQSPGQLQLLDPGNDLDPRNVAKYHPWVSRFRFGIRPDGSIASCQPTASYGAVWLDQSLCDIMKKKGRYEFDKPQSGPPSAKSDSTIKYTDKSIFYQLGKLSNIDRKD